MFTDLLGTTLPRLAAPLFPHVTWRGPTHSPEGKPCLYLTFDDGPHPDSTPRLLDFLSTSEVPATFFHLGSHAELFPELVRATHQAGHAVGNHGWVHRSAWSAPKSVTLADFERAEELLGELTGRPVQNVRPPFGRFTPALRRWCNDGKRRLILWDLMPGDFLTSLPSTEELVQRISSRIVERIRPGSIVVLHESAHSHSIVLPVLNRTLPLLRDDGWTIAPL